MKDAVLSRAIRGTVASRPAEATLSVMRTTLALNRIEMVSNGDSVTVVEP
jgi:hypothetical protein